MAEDYEPDAYNIDINPWLSHINQTSELPNLVPTPSNFLLFSSGTLVDDHAHQNRNISHFSSSLLHGNLGGNGTVEEKNGSRRRRKRSETLNDDDLHLQKPRDVVHIRAKRGQATDSHSLAERVRREKINERLRSLQDLVPGCYKTMGMAVMLDVIIDYVRSLHNQIEFLSMKLSAASAYYDFNSVDIEPTNIYQGTNIYNAETMEMMLRNCDGTQPPNFTSTLPF